MSFRDAIFLYAAMILLAALLVPYAAQAQVTSPDGRVTALFEMTTEGTPVYSVHLNGDTLLQRSSIGIATTMGSWETNLTLVGTSEVQAVGDAYRLAHGKQRDVQYEANRRVVHLANEQGHELKVIFQVSNDGVAFRYRIPEQGDADVVAAHSELTGFRFPADTRTWLMPMDPPDSGWSQTFPAYEAHYRINQPVGVASPTGVGWAFPALFHREGVGWALVTEAAVLDSYVASRLDVEGDARYRIAFPEPGEGTGVDDPVVPSFTLPFASPWRLIIVGETLGPIVESTLVTDVSPPSQGEDTAWVEPGKAAWSWLPLKDDSVVPEVQRRFIDMAAEYSLEYVLVDNWWDQQIGYDTLQTLADYAARKGVDLLVWYNSNGAFNEAPQTPKDRMSTPGARREEFQRLREMGIEGVKVDFMGGDKQSVVQLYLNILRDAADYDVLVNFHGATLPRGWHRTYPNYMTAEAVRGYEYTTFGQADADAAPVQGTVLPFTRNVVGPMDYTPTMLTDQVGASVRRTSNGYDLAMLVVFESGIQHLGVTPQVMASVPEYVSEYIGGVPAAWDETRFVGGVPGEYVIIARRRGDSWYVAGVNGQNEPRTVTVDLPFLDESWSGAIITDGEEGSDFSLRAASNGMQVRMQAYGGFVMTDAVQSASSE